MNLIFRLLKTLLRYFLLPSRIGILEESLVRFRVWPNDLDTNLHMNNGRYLTLLDLGRLDLLLRNGSVPFVIKNKWYPVLAGSLVRFRRPLNLFQTFEIRTRIVTWDAKWVYLEQKMARRGEAVMHAYLKGVFVGPEGSVPITRLLGLMGIGEAPPSVPPALEAWLRADEAMARASRDGDAKA